MGLPAHSELLKFTTHRSYVFLPKIEYVIPNTFRRVPHCRTHIAQRSPTTYII